MGDAFIVRRGGGGSFAWDSAIIHIYAPAGSTVTVTNGSTEKTLKENVVVGADSEYIMVVKYADYGTWTITATLSGKTATQTVAVVDNVEYPVYIIYGLVLYDGTLSTQSLRECTAVTGGWHGRNADTYYSLGTFTSGASFIQISRTGAQAVTAETVNKIDLTLFSTLKVKVTQRQTNMRLCVNANTPMGYNTESYIDLPSTGEYSLDVSSLSGEYYVGIATWGEGANGANRFDRVVLE